MGFVHIFWHLLTRKIQEISSLESEDGIKLIAHYNSLMRDNGQSDESLADRGYSEAMLAQLNKHKAEKFSPIKSCGLRFTKPYTHLKYDYFDYVMVLFENYENGILPFPGSVSEQPAKIMEIFSVLKQLKFEQEQRLHSRLKEDGRHKRTNQLRDSR